MVLCGYKLLCYCSSTGCDSIVRIWLLCFCWSTLKIVMVLFGYGCYAIVRLRVAIGSLGSMLPWDCSSTLGCYGVCLSQVAMLLMLGQRVACGWLSREQHNISPLWDIVTRLIVNYTEDFIVSMGGWVRIGVIRFYIIYSRTF